MIHFGVIHATQRISPTLHVTAASLEVAGVPFFTVFPDSGGLGASANLDRAIRFMSKSARHEDHVCVLDDDLVIGSLAPLYAAVERDPRGLYSLWTIEQNIPHERRRETGWIGVAIEGIPFNGSTSAASKLCINKNETLLVLEKAGIRTTKRLLINKKTSQEEIIKKIEEIFSKTKNFIIKPNDDGCSALVFFAKEIDELLKLSTLIFESKEECLIEEYIDDRELTVGVLGNKEKNTVLPITEAKKSKTLLSLEEKFLPGAGENITPAEFNDEDGITIQKTIKDAYEAIGCDGYARIDCFWKSEEKKLIILECHSLPALTPATCFFHQTAELEINPTETLEYIIYLGLLKHSKNHQVIEFMKTKTQKTTKKIQKLPHI